MRSTSSDVKSTARVFIPARNEAAAIGRIVRGCRRAGFSVTVIDDASSDATALLAAEAGAEVLALSGPHHGKTAALHHALAGPPGAGLYESVEWLFFLDGDGQHHPADLERFWNMRSHADLIVGNRFTDAAHMHLYVVYPVLLAFLAGFLTVGLRNFRGRVLS